MKPSLDLHPVDSSYAQSCVKRGIFVVVAQGDPRVSIAPIDGMAHIRKFVGPRWTLKTIECGTETSVVPSIPLAVLMEDTGISSWGEMRVANDSDLALVLAELPGPIADRILLPAPASGALMDRLSRWYFVGETPETLVLVEPRV